MFRSLHHPLTFRLSQVSLENPLQQITNSVEVLVAQTEASYQRQSSISLFAGPSALVEEVAAAVAALVDLKLHQMNLD